MIKHKTLLLLGLLALLAGLASAQGVSFGLFGDTPYSQWERERLPELMAEMDREELSFYGLDQGDGGRD